MHESRHISCFLQNFGISVVINKCQQLIKDSLDVRNFLEVARDHRHLCEKSLLFSPKLLIKFTLQLHFLLIQFPIQISETLIYIL